MDKPSQSKRIIKYIKDKYDTDPEYLWVKFPNYSVFRNPLSGKWFAGIMDVPESKLGLEGEKTVEVINVKCGHIMAGSLLKEKGFFSAYHMKKDNWVSVILDGTVSDERIAELLELSYFSTLGKKKR